MAEFTMDLRDIRFVIFEWLKAEERLGALPAFAEQGREMWEMVLEEAAALAAGVLAPVNAPGDRQGCRREGDAVYLPDGFKAAYEEYRKGGWVNPAGSPEHGGMGLPTLLAAACGELFMAANNSFMFTPGLTGAASRVIEHEGSAELRDLYVARMNSGQWAGTMCMTEPQAGSAVGDSATRAVRQSDGTYLIAGSKIFISQGEQDLTENIVHLVLARTLDAPAGTKGLSLFVVPKFIPTADGRLGPRNDVRCTGIEEKMGIHASSTCSLSFGDEGRCQGFIIGGEGEGMRHMFLMMNEARLEVGMQGVASGNRAFQIALAYAKERIQGPHARDFRNPDAPRVAIIEHPNVRRTLMECKALGEGARALLYRTSWHLDMAHRAATEAERERHDALVGLLTPIVKAYCSEAGMHIADRCMQVLGGYGYIKEYGIEQILRDVRIAQIYEGTNSIQALDLIARKIGRKGGMHLMWLMGEIGGFVEAHKEHHGLRAEIARLKEAQAVLIRISMQFAACQVQGDVEYPVLVCDEYLAMFGDVVVGWCLLEQAVLAEERRAAIQERDPEAGPQSDPEVRFYDTKVKTAGFFVHQILPRAIAAAGRIESGDRSALNAHL